METAFVFSLIIWERLFRRAVASDSPIADVYLFVKRVIDQRPFGTLRCPQGCTDRGPIP